MVNYDIAQNKAVYKYFPKSFYNRTNKKEYNLQIWLYNIYHMDIFIMKNMIKADEKNNKNGEPLVIENVDKTTIVEVIKVSNIKLVIIWSTIN